MFSDPTIKPIALMTEAMGRVDVDPGVSVALVWAGGEQVLAVPLTEQDTDALNVAVTANYVQALGMAVRVKWSPTSFGKSSDAWQLTVVHPDAPARFLVRRLVEDNEWRSIDPADAPWFALSTASGMRTAIMDKKPMVLKRATDDKLFRRVDEATPDVDDQGLI